MKKHNSKKLEKLIRKLDSWIVHSVADFSVGPDDYSSLALEGLARDAIEFGQANASAELHGFNCDEYFHFFIGTEKQITARLIAARLQSKE